MPWVRIDEDFAQHPKLMQAGPLGMAMQVAGLCYCNRNLTDGVIPRSAARTLLDWEIVDGEGHVWTVARTSGMSGDDIDSQWVIDLLLEAGIWKLDPRGYRIHDYEDYQPTRAEVEAEREKNRGAARARWDAPRKRRAKRPASKPDTPRNASGMHDASDPHAERNPLRMPVPGPVPVSGSDLGLIANGLESVSEVGADSGDKGDFSKAERHRLAHVLQGKPDPENCDLCAHGVEAV